jgi:hypothetical protein
VCVSACMLLIKVTTKEILGRGHLMSRAESNVQMYPDLPNAHKPHKYCAFHVRADIHIREKTCFDGLPSGIAVRVTDYCSRTI